jgi:hypothetical protein
MTRLPGETADFRRHPPGMMRRNSASAILNKPGWTGPVPRSVIRVGLWLLGFGVWSGGVAG